MKKFQIIRKDPDRHHQAQARQVMTKEKKPKPKNHQKLHLHHQLQGFQ